MFATFCKRKPNMQWTYHSRYLKLAKPKQFIPSPSLKSRIGSAVEEFCSKSSIHGVRYFVERERPWYERIWWIFAFIISMILCGCLIYVLVPKWIDNRVIIQFHHPYSIEKVPFPAITICPGTKTCAEKFNYTDIYRSMFKLDGNRSRTVTQKEKEIVKTIGQTCEWITFDIFSSAPDKYLNDSMLSTITDMAPKCEETMDMCKLFDTWASCVPHLVPMITEDGLCYTFNALNLEEIVTDQTAPFIENTTNPMPKSNWFTEYGYKDTNNQKSYPHRVFGTGGRSSFGVFMKTLSSDIDLLCGGPFQGFKIIVHAPNELPQAWKNQYTVSYQQHLQITARPNLIITNPNAVKYSPSVRQCYFAGERKLYFFKEYTQSNCAIECLSNYTLAQCGCVKFSMPRTRNTNICGPAKLLCITVMGTSIFESGAYRACNCLPSCFSLSYDVETSQKPYELPNVIEKSKFSNAFDYDSYNFSMITVSFKEKVFIPSERFEFRSLTEFLANAGGVFGLFMGASLISFLEFIYYFTIRIFHASPTNQFINGFHRTFRNEPRMFTVRDFH